MQHVDAAVMEHYVLFRDFGGSVKLIDANGDKVDANSFKDMSVVFC